MHRGRRDPRIPDLVSLMRDGDGNLIAPDGLLYPKIYVRFGRDFMRGPRCWSFEIAWDLRDDPKPGERVYARMWGISTHIYGF